MTESNPAPSYGEIIDAKDPPLFGWNEKADVKHARKILADTGDIFEDGDLADECFCKLYSLGIDPNYAVEMIDARWPELHQILDLRLDTINRLLACYARQRDRPGRDARGDEFEGTEDGGWKDPSVRMVGGLTTQMVDEAKSERLRWLWPKRFPIGKVSLLAGYPDQGKSLITLAMAATVTTGGDWPNGEGKANKGVVIILSAEDTVGDTIKPRLLAAGADTSKIMTIEPMVSQILKGSKLSRVFNVADDLENLTKIIKQFEAKGETVRMIIFDPLNAYFGGKSKVDSHNTSEMRALLTPISKWCSTRGVAVIGIMHFNKGDNTNALYRITGSNAIGAVARAAWITIEDPETKKMMMLRGKTNLAKKDPNKTGLAYKIDETAVDDPEFAGDVFPFIKWGEVVDVSANEALKPPTRNREALAVDIAKRELAAYLADGPKPTDSIDDLARACSVSLQTMRRAKEELGVRSMRPKKVGGKFQSFLPKSGDYFGPDDPDEFEGQDDADEFEGHDS